MRIVTRGPLTGLPLNFYGSIYIDPPWRFRAWAGDDAGDRAPPYPTMSLDEMTALEVADIAARDCWLSMWTFGAHFAQAVQLGQDLGFRFSSIGWTWIKMRESYDAAEHDGWMEFRDFSRSMGKTTRKFTELVLLFKRGEPPVLEVTDELVLEPIREHSRKPDEVRRRVERFAGGPRLEMFARQRFPGWHAWGNETGKWAPMLSTSNSPGDP